MVCRTDIVTCAKNAYLILNITVALGSLILISYGIAVITKITGFTVLIHDNIIFMVSISIASGILALYSAGIGFFGVTRESRWVLFWNVMFFIGLAGVKFWMSVAIFSEIDYVYIMMRSTLDVAAVFERQLLLLMEKRFLCCGSIGARSYLDFNLTVPDSCCADPIKGACDASVSYPGCSRVVADFLEAHGVVIGSTAFRTAVVEVAAACSGIFLIDTIRIKLIDIFKYISSVLYKLIRIMYKSIIRKSYVRNR